MNTTQTVLMNFIEQVKESGKIVAIFLSTGVKLQGYIIDYDDNSIRIRCARDKTSIIVFIQHITTISDKENTDNTDRGVFG